MKPAIAIILLAAVFATQVLANDPAIPAESRDRFLNGVHDFAGGKLTTGAPATPPGPGGGAVSPSSNAGSSSSPASWRSSNGKVNGGSLVGGTIVPTTIPPTPVVPQNITPAQNQPQKIVSPWSR